MEEKPPKEETQIAEPKHLPNKTPTLAIPNPEPPQKEETPIPDVMLDFKDDLFVEYGNTLKYYATKKP